MSNRERTWTDGVDWESVALLAIVAALSAAVAIGAWSYNVAQGKRDVEAIKAGLVQNERGQWVEKGAPR